MKKRATTYDHDEGSAEKARRDGIGYWPCLLVQRSRGTSVREPGSGLVLRL